MISEVKNIDCMIAMREFPDKFFSLGIVDPPYGVGTIKNKFQNNRDTGTYKNRSIPSPEYFKELERVCGNHIIWGCQYFLPHLNPIGSFIIWDKKIDPDLHNMSSCDVAWYSKKERIRTFDGHWNGAVKCEPGPTIHVHQKPVMLYKWLLRHYAKKGDKILDTHLGSGSSRIAAAEMGFDFWGFEIDKKYFDGSETRFNQYKAQQKLFA